MVHLSSYLHRKELKTCVKHFFRCISTRFRVMTCRYCVSRWPSLDTPHSIGFVAQLIGPTHRPVPDNTQHSLRTNFHASGGNRTRSPRNQSTHALDRAATGIGAINHNTLNHHSWKRPLTSLDQIHHASLTRPSIRYRPKFRNDVRLGRRNNCPAKQMLIKVEGYSNTLKINHDAMTCNMRHEECPRSPWWITLMQNIKSICWYSRIPTWHVSYLHI